MEGEKGKEEEDGVEGGEREKERERTEEYNVF